MQLPRRRPHPWPLRCGSGWCRAEPQASLTHRLLTHRLRHCRDRNPRLRSCVRARRTRMMRQFPGRRRTGACRCRWTCRLRWRRWVPGPVRTRCRVSHCRPRHREQPHNRLPNGLPAWPFLPSRAVRCRAVRYRIRPARMPKRGPTGCRPPRAPECRVPVRRTGRGLGVSTGTRRRRHGCRRLQLRPRLGRANGVCPRQRHRRRWPARPRTGSGPLALNSQPRLLRAIRRRQFGRPRLHRRRPGFRRWRRPRRIPMIRRMTDRAPGQDSRCCKPLPPRRVPWCRMW